MNITTSQDRYDLALQLLNGTVYYKVSCIISVMLSISLLCWGISIVDISKEQHILCILAVSYLISSSFGLAKALLDESRSKVVVSGNGTDLMKVNGSSTTTSSSSTTTTTTWLAGGITSWWYQSILSFALALVTCFYAIHSMAVTDIVRAFLLIGLSFVISSTIFLAKTLRDGQDTAYFQQAMINGNDNPNQADDTNLDTKCHMMVALCFDTHAKYNPLTWFLFVVDLGAFFYMMIVQLRFEVERYDLLVLGVFFTIFSALMLGKALRDVASNATILHPTKLHWCMYVIAPILSSSLTLDVILSEMPIGQEVKIFLVMNIVCIFSVTTSLAKVIRDGQELDYLSRQFSLGGNDQLYAFCNDIGSNNK